MNEEAKCPNCGHYSLEYENHDYTNDKGNWVTRNTLRCKNCNILLDDSDSS